jgi:hypothetical protein
MQTHNFYSEKRLNLHRVVGQVKVGFSRVVGAVLWCGVRGVFGVTNGLGGGGARGCLSMLRG